MESTAGKNGNSASTQNRQLAPVSEFKPTSMFSVDGDGDDVLKDDDIRKIARLQLINASARFELLSANQQLIDFHLNRVMNTMLKKQQQRKAE